MSSWKEFWNKDNDSFYEKIAKFYRRNLFATEGRIYTDKYFPEKGVFVECGSGSAACSVKISKKKRSGIALDLCIDPLKKIDASIIDNSVQGTIFKLPFKDKTIDGIWNFGVMEHFKEDDLILILSEFNRVLKNDGKIVLFWPWAHGPFTLYFDLKIFIEKVFSKFGIIISEMYPEMYPDAYSTIKYTNSIRSLLESCDFFETKFKLSPYGLFVHYVVTASKLDK